MRIFPLLKHIEMYLLPLFFYEQISNSSDAVVVLMDFAQNFALSSQREVQSAHFDKPQTTVFTALVVIGSERRNFVIISDYVEHVRLLCSLFPKLTKKPLTSQDAKFAYFVQQMMVSNVKQLAPNVGVINYPTDGGPSHFKNRYNMLILTFHKTDFGVRAVWSFSAISHGKGPVEGLGATIKSTAARYLMRHGPGEAFKNGKEFYNFSVKHQQSSKSSIEV